LNTYIDPPQPEMVAATDTEQPEMVAKAETTDTAPEIRQIGPDTYEATTPNMSAIAFRSEDTGRVMLLLRPDREEEDRAELLRQIDIGGGNPCPIWKPAPEWAQRRFTRFTIPDCPAVFVILAAYHEAPEGGNGNA